MTNDLQSHETLVRELMDDAKRHEYSAPYDNYRPGIVARIVAWFLITPGNFIYGHAPSYQKFKSIEIIARIPYQSWEVVSYTLLTLFHGDENHALALAKTANWSRLAQDNETMHVVVLSHLAHKLGRSNVLTGAIVPIIFSVFYFLASYVLYLVCRRSALELNFLFEKHAYAQYQAFLDQQGDALRHRPVVSDFLVWYGREVRNEYELFETIRNDELIHRNRSIHEIEARKA